MGKNSLSVLKSFPFPLQLRPHHLPLPHPVKEIRARARVERGPHLPVHPRTLLLVLAFVLQSQPWMSCKEVDKKVSYFGTKSVKRVMIWKRVRVKKYQVNVITNERSHTVLNFIYTKEFIRTRHTYKAITVVFWCPVVGNLQQREDVTLDWFFRALLTFKLPEQSSNSSPGTGRWNGWFTKLCWILHNHTGRCIFQTVRLLDKE